MDFNGDNVQASLKEGIQWEDEIHIAKMWLYLHLYSGNTDLFIDYSSFNRDLYYAPSELTYDIYGDVNYQNYYGTNGTKNRLNEADGDSFNLDTWYTPVAIEQITDSSNGQEYVGNYLLLAYDNSASEFVGYMFDNYGYLLANIGALLQIKE